MINLYFSYDFKGGLITIILLSLGTSLGSGNGESLLYEKFSENNHLDLYKVYISNANSISYMLFSIYAIISGFVFDLNLNLVLILDIIFMIVNIISTIIFLDEKMKISNTQNKKIIEGFSIKDLYKIFKVFIISALIFTYFRTTYNFYQPIYSNFKIEAKVFGFFTVGFNLLVSLGSQIYKKHLVYLSSKKIVNLIIFILLGLSILLFLTRNNMIIVLISIFLMQLIRGIFISYQPLFINDIVPKDTKYRTTYISLASFITTAISFLFILSSGFLTKYLELFQSLLITSITICLLTILFNEAQIRKKIKKMVPFSNR